MYYTLNDSNEPRFYISLTTLTSATLPTAPNLIKWIADTGYKESRDYMKERAEYGTLMHHGIGEFVIKKTWDFDKTGEFIEKCLTDGVIAYTKPEWEDDLKNDIAAFAQFVYDYKVIPMAIEIVLVSEDGYGTLIDLVCKMTVQVDGLSDTEVYQSGKNKGKPKPVKVDKQITALINFKSGRHGFYDEHEIQLEFEKRLFQENYPDIKIDAIYNWSPKEWRKSPTYNLKDQSDSLNAMKAEALLNIARIELMKRIPKMIISDGQVKYGNEPQAKEYTVYDIVKKRHSETVLTK